MKQSPSWNANSRLATQETFRLLWNSKVHYRVHKSHHWSLSSARCSQSTSFHPIFLRSILKLSPYLHLCLPSYLLFRLFDQNFVCISHHSHACYLPRPPHSPWFYRPNNNFFIISVFILPSDQRQVLLSGHLPWGFRLKLCMPLSIVSGSVVSNWPLCEFWTCVWWFFWYTYFIPQFFETPDDG
jgi:hypothetical protein